MDIPLLLAAHGFRTGLVDMVESEEPVLTTTRGITCVAVAHVHHNAGKMALYQERIGSVGLLHRPCRGARVGA